MSNANTIKAIQTIYKGVRFRSRLEARWAVFFDELKIKWVYEPEGFLIGRYEDIPYLPDFYLSDLDVYIEVKPSYEWEHCCKCYGLERVTGKTTFLIHGQPRIDQYTITRIDMFDVPELDKFNGNYTCDSEPLLAGYNFAELNGTEKVIFATGENYLVGGVYVKRFTTIPMKFTTETYLLGSGSSKIVSALSMASSYRFELGDRGAHYKFTKSSSTNQKAS